MKKIEKKCKIAEMNNSTVLRGKGGRMEIRTVEDLEPVVSGDLEARERFIAAYRGMVSYCAARVNPRTGAADSSDIEARLWDHVTGNDWELVRKYEGRGSFEGYLKRCLSFKAIDIGRKFTNDKQRELDCLSERARELRSVPYNRFETLLLDRIDSKSHNCARPSRFVEGTAEYHDFLIGIMRECIEQLPCADRLLLKMAVYDNATAEQIKEVLGLRGVSSVYTRKHRVVARLKKLCKARLQAVAAAAA